MDDTIQAVAELSIPVDERKDTFFIVVGMNKKDKQTDSNFQNVKVVFT